MTIHDDNPLSWLARRAPLPVVMAGSLVVLVAVAVTEPAHRLLQRVLPD